VVIGTDCTGSCKSNYDMITITTAPLDLNRGNCMSRFNCINMYFFQILRLSTRYDVDKDVMCFTGGLTLDRQQLQHGGFGSLTDTIFSFY
jgi:hypothetical protein